MADHGRRDRLIFCLVEPPSVEATPDLPVVTREDVQDDLVAAAQAKVDGYFDTAPVRWAAQDLRPGLVTADGGVQQWELWVEAEGPCPGRDPQPDEGDVYHLHALPEPTPVEDASPPVDGDVS